MNISTHITRNLTLFFCCCLLTTFKPQLFLLSLCPMFWQADEKAWIFPSLAPAEDSAHASPSPLSQPLTIKTQTYLFSSLKTFATV